MKLNEKIVFIDRDGIINVDPIGDYIKRWEDFRFENGALEGLRILSEAAYKIIVISNQAGVGDGIYPEAALWDIHSHMLRELAHHKINIQDAFYCLHGKKAGCKCRKPEIGLFLQAEKKYSINKQKTFFIGDKATDIAAGSKFGLKTIFVLTGHGPLDRPKLKSQGLVPDHIVNSLPEAARIITE